MIRTIVIAFRRILFIFVFQSVFMGYGISQTIHSKISLNCNDVSLESVLKLLQQRFHIEFIYDAALVLNKEVNCNLDSVSLDEALERLLLQYGIVFKKYSDNSVVLFNSYPAKTSIFGVIIDSISREKLAGANIYIKNNPSLGTASDKNGFFRLDNIPEQCTLIIDYIGYEPAEYIIKDEKKKPNYIYLKESPLLEKEITVAAKEYPSSIFRSGSGQTQFSPDKVQLLPSMTNGDIMRSIQLTPGVKTIQDQIDGLYIQKGTPDQNLILLDGIQVIRGEHLWGYYNALNTNAIKNVTVHKAGFTSKFGDRLSSIIELEGDAGKGDNVELGAGADIFCMNSFVKIPIHSKLRTAFAMRRSFKSAGFNSMYNNFEDYIFLLKRRYHADLDHRNMFRFYDLVGKLGYDLSENSKFAMTSFTTYDKVDISTINKDKNDNDGKRFEEWKDLGIGLNWKIKWNEKILSNFHTSYSKYKNKYFYQYNLYGNVILIDKDGNEIYDSYSIPVDEFNYYDVNHLSYKSDHLFRINDRFSFLAGVELNRTEIEHHMPDKHFLYKTDNSSDNVNEYELFIDMPVACKSWSNIFYLENHFNFNKNLNVTLGLRNNFYSLLMKNYTDPRIEISYDLFGIKLKSVWGKYHQYLHRMSIDAGDFNPMRTSYYWMLAYDQLKPESAEHLLLAAVYNTGEYEFSINYFNKEYQNIVKLIPGVQFTSVNNYSNYIQIDNGQGLSRGIEFVIKKNSGFLTGWISYQMGFAKFKFNQINQHQWYDADFDRRHELNIVGLLEKRTWQLSLLNIFATGTPYSTADNTIFSIPIEYDFYSYTDPTNINNNRQPFYQRSDIKFTYNLFLTSKFTFQTGFTLFNILNHKNVIDQYYINLEDYNNNHKSNITELNRTLFLFCNFVFK